MSEELDILKIIARNPAISQRKIAEQTGISLGQVNFLLKKFAKKGMLKIEGQTSKSIRYNLTPKGITEKTTLTMEYIKISYGAVIKLTDGIRALADQYENDGKKIYVFGEEDEMMEICKLALGNRAEYIRKSDGLERIISGSICMHWEDHEPDKSAANDLQEKRKDIIWANIIN